MKSIEMRIDGDSAVCDLGVISSAPRFVAYTEGDQVRVNVFDVPELSLIESEAVADLMLGIEPLAMEHYKAEHMAVDPKGKVLTVEASNGVWRFDLLPAHWSDDKRGDRSRWMLARLVTK